MRHSGDMLGEVVAGVPAAALLALQRRLRHAVRDQHDVAQVQGQVPAGVVGRAALGADVRGPLAQLVQLGERRLDLVFLADDADQVAHGLLDLGVDRVGVLAAGALQRGERLGPRRLEVSVAGRRPGAAQGVQVGRRAQAGPAAEHQQVGQGVAAEPVGAVHAAGHLARREQAGHDRRGGVRVHLDAAHHVVLGRADLHRLLGDVDVGQLLELVVHRRQPAQDLLGRAPGGDVQEHAAVRRTAAGLDLGVDWPGRPRRGAAARAGAGCGPGRRTSGRPPPRSPRTGPGTRRARSRT